MTEQSHHPDIVVLGASAGGVSALTSIVQALPRNLPAAIFVVLHVHPASKSVLAPLLARTSGMKVETSVDGQPIEHGHIYIAPPDHHLTVEADTVRVTYGPLQNRHRPSIDVLFRSAAMAYGPRVIGVVLTGFLSDGTVGLAAIKDLGGISVVQDPKTAAYPDMPDSALRSVKVDHCVSLEEIPDLIVRLCARARPARTVDQDLLNAHRFESDADQGHVHDLDKFTKPSAFLCPDCGGALWELKAGMPRFRCRVGHSYSLTELTASQQAQVETALWAATHSLEDNAELNHRLAEQWRERDFSSELAEQFQRKGEKSEQHAATLRDLLGVKKQIAAT